MKRALVLAAGGVTGALYEVGVLRAIEEQHGPLHQLFDVRAGAGRDRATGPGVCVRRVSHPACVLSPTVTSGPS